MISANVGTPDRILRAILGAILAALPFFVPSMALPGMTGIVSLAAGGIFLVTGAIKFCPIYGMFGWRTRQKS